MSTPASTESVTAILMMGSLKTDSSVLEVVSAVREVRGGGIVSGMLYDVPMISPSVGMPSCSPDEAATETSSSFRSWLSPVEAAAAKLGRMGSCMAEPGEKRWGRVARGDHHG